MTPPTTSDTGGALVVQRTYDLLLWLLPEVETFPRSHRFTLGFFRDVAHRWGRPSTLS